MRDRLEERIVALNAGSRRILINAAACFIATALLAFVPQEWKVVGFVPSHEFASRTGPVSGKFLDRVETPGANLSTFEERRIAPIMANFTSQPNLEIMSDIQKDVAKNELAAEKPTATAARPTKGGAARKQERVSETKSLVEAAAPWKPAKATVDAPASLQETRQKPEDLEQNLLARLNPTSLASKLPSVGQKAWNGAAALGGALSDWVGASGFLR
jgi:hypothetical protein